ncbi:MAG: DegT/DnrJ/EryC1/StrS family aminotransferase [Flavobacteriales bacterium]|jgi:perosamine synthetase
MMNTKPIPVNTPLLGEREKELLNECIDTGWISSEGPFIAKFESEMSKYVGRNYGVAVSNGSAALDICIKALEIAEGDEVIMPTFTIISPAQSVVSAGATPVLVESDLSTWNMDVSAIESKITSKTKAILVVHIYGFPVDMDPVIDLCNKYNLYLIEDAAEMHGQTYKGKKCGSFGTISTFSFYPNKHITTGEGGMIMCDDEKIAERCRKLRNLAFEPGRRFVHNEIGWNYRMTNLQAALGLAQLERIDQHILRKKEIGTRYYSNLSKLSGFEVQPTHLDYAENIFWIYGLLAETQELNEAMQKHLSANQIGTRPFFWCMHEQPVFQKKGLFKNEIYPNAEKLARNGFYVPSGLGITNEEIDTVCEVIASFKLG